jgi:hypothetical protein
VIVPSQGVYKSIVKHIFEAHYKPGNVEVPFVRDDIVAAAKALGFDRPKNLGDVIYNVRYRSDMPESIQVLAPEGHEWIIRSVDTGKYKFVAVVPLDLTPNRTMAVVKIPDATPGVIAMYALSDEQALLAKLRYNRLIDVFMGMACYSLQNHLRTQIKRNQIETDEVYVGVDRRGIHYVIPVQAKGGTDRLSVVQIEQDVAMCRSKFSATVCRPVAAQFLGSDQIVLFELTEEEGEMRIVAEKHYLLVPPDQLPDEELRSYQTRGE